MENILILDTEIIQIVEKMNEMHCIFHPLYSVNGVLRPDWLMEMKKTGKEIVINLDRNIFTEIVEIVQNGKLKREEDLRKVATLLFWAEMNGFSVMSYDAIAENAYKIKDNKCGREELECFDFAFKNIMGKTWLDAALGKIQNINPVIGKNIVPQDKTINFCYESVDYLMHYATMIHMVKNIRKGINEEEQFYDLLSWYFDNCWVCQYVISYIILYFSHIEKVVAPKKSRNSDINIVLEGCYNQARDIFYLSEWSKVYANPYYDKYIHLFATFDIGLSRIFTNVHGLQSEKDAFNVLPAVKCEKYYQFYKELCKKHTKLHIEGNEYQYCYKLIDSEIADLRRYFKN